MSKFTDFIGTSHALSLAAMEEASRVGQRTADIDQLFIALVLSEQTAGQVLRSFGITLDSAREAVAEQHTDQLIALGVQAVAPQPGRIVFHKTGGYEWSDRALKLFERANERGKRGDASAVLHELLAEPSGMIQAVLGRLGTTPQAIASKLDEAERYPSHRPQAVSSDSLVGTSETFVPASPEPVWELLAAPARISEWEPTIGSATRPPATPEVGDTWTVLARTQSPDGKPIRIKREFITQQVELAASEASRLIEWRFTYPQVSRANPRHVRIQLEPAAGGTQLHLTLSWERNPNRHRPTLLGKIMRPFFRLVLRMQMSQLTNAISRAFR